MAGSLALLMNLYPSEIVYCMVASHLPDQMEMIGGWRIIGHRTWTHEILLWLLPLLVTQLFPHLIPGAFSIGAENVDYRYVTIRSWVLFLPGLFHLLGDLLTPGGVRFGGHKISLGLFKTGHLLEYVVTGLFVLLAVVHKLSQMHFAF